MSVFVIAAPAQATVAVAGTQALLPVGRVFCIGRNYAWSLGEARPPGMPAWFMKPASAVVPAQGLLPYPGVGPLQPGDVITAGVDGIGSLSMAVGPPHTTGAST